MKALGLASVWTTGVRRLRDGARRRILTAALVSCGVVLFAIAVGFAFAAGYMWLALQLPDHWAALCMAGGLALLGGLVVAIAIGRGRSRAGRAESSSDILDQAEAAAAPIASQLASQVKAAPSSAMVTALMLGVVVGLLRNGDDGGPSQGR